MQENLYKETNDNPFLLGFFSAEDAWFWCCRCRLGVRERFCKQDNQRARVCETNDIYIVLKKLLDCRLISHRHIKILVRFGKEQSPPNPKYGNTRKECHLWRQAITEMEKELRSRGIVK